MLRINFTLDLLEEKQFRSYSEWAMQVIEPQVGYLCRKYKIRNMEADDVAQELRIHVWEKLPTYNPTKGTFKSWAYTVMRNKLTYMNWSTIHKKSRNMLDAEHRVVHDLEFDPIDMDETVQWSG